MLLPLSYASIYYWLESEPQAVLLRELYLLQLSVRAPNAIANFWCDWGDSNSHAKKAPVPQTGVATITPQSHKCIRVWELTAGLDRVFFHLHWQF
jgi:hypothetical protein